MTTERFCAQCGKEAGGGAFCQHCGAAQTVAAPAAATPISTPAAPALNAFCPSCGTKAEPGLAFCTKCGANLATGVPLAPSQYVRPAGAVQSKTPIYVGVGAVVVAVIVAFMVMSGGDDSVSNSGGSSSSSASNGASGTGSSSNGSTQASTSKTVGVVKPQPLPAGVKPSQGNTGGNNAEAAKAIRASLQGSGLNLTGIDVFVFPIPAKAGESMLVIDIPDQAKAPALAPNAPSGDSAKIFGALASSPGMKTANVKQVVVTFKDKDAKGPFKGIMAMPVSLVDAFAKGAQPTAAQMKQLKYTQQR